MDGTLVMLHGMTGTSNKMIPLANKLVPDGWDILCPEAIIPHPTRGGFAWWLRDEFNDCLLYTSPSPRDKRQSRMPSSA